MLGAVCLFANVAMSQAPIVVQAVDGVLGGNPLPTIQPCTTCDFNAVYGGGVKIGSNENNGIKNTSWATYTVNMPTGGLYKIDIDYSAGWNDTFFEIQVNNNSFSYRPYPKGTGSWDVIGSMSTYINLQAGSNTIKFWNSYWIAPNFSKFTLTKAADLVSQLEAEDAARGGTAVIQDDSALSGGKGIGGNVHGRAGWVTFTTNVPTAGKYTIRTTYNDSQNDNDRYFKIIVNAPITITDGKIDDTGIQFGDKKGSGPNGCTTDQGQKIDLIAGENKITFYSDWFAPRLDRILILDTEGVLPVVLTKFTAKATNTAAVLNWATSSEQNSNHFAVMRSGDGQSFTKIGEIKAAGNSSELKNYEFKDVSPLNGTNYYQLYQYDNDATLTKSEIKTASLTLDASQQYVKVLNLGNDNVAVEIYIPTAKNGTIVITNINGQVVTKKNFVLDSGRGRISVPVNGTTGVYIATVNTAEKSLREKFLKR